MKNLKTIITLCLVLACALSLAACGSGSNSNAGVTAPIATYAGSTTTYGAPAPGYEMTDATKVYASGDIYNMYMKKESLRTEIWSDDASLSAAEKAELMDTFAISNVTIDVNAADNTFEAFDFNAAGIVDTEHSVWD